MKTTVKDTDKAIRNMLRRDLPHCPDNPYLIKKINNRLPERRWFRTSRIEIGFYAVAALALVALYVFCIASTLVNGFTPLLLFIAAIMPVITLVCIGVFAAPAIKRLFSE